MPVNSFEDYPMTWKPELNRNSGPLYLALADRLERDILDGLLLPGTKLPPQRELADFLDINVSTVSKAFRVCELKGLLSATIGSGTYVSYNALTNLRLLADKTSTHIIDMGATVPNADANKLLLAHLKDMLSEADAERYFRYNRPGDTTWQKDAAVSWLKGFGLETEPESIFFSNGGQNAIAAVLMGLFREGDRIGVSPHTYSDMKSVAVMLGIQLFPIKHTDDEIDIDALVYTCKNYNLKGVYIISDCQNPTTRTMTAAERKALASLAKKQDILIIEDGTYSPMSGALPSIASFAPERTIFIASLSKAIAPGLRLAYLSIPPNYRQRVSDALYNLNISVSPISAELTARLIASGQVNEVLRINRQKTALRNQIVDAFLSDYDCRGGEACIFRWLNLPESITGTEFEELALKHGVQVYAAKRFAVGITTPDSAVRLAICAPPEISEMERGLKILKQLLDGL